MTAKAFAVHIFTTLSLVSPLNLSKLQPPVSLYFLEFFSITPTTFLLPSAIALSAATVSNKSKTITEPSLNLVYS